MASSRWCFTLNNYTQDDEDSFRVVGEANRYLVYGRETGESGTPHLQGFIVFKNAQRLAAVKKINPRAHWEVAKGTSEQAAEYCKKDRDVVEIHTCPTRGGQDIQKRAFEEAFNACAEGKLDEVPKDIRFRYYNTCKRIRTDHAPMPPDADEVTGVWIWGEAGVGKSRKARTDYPDAFMKLPNKWFDGYQDQEYVIIDDVSPNHKELGDYLKLWMDRYAFTAEVKGGMITLRPRKVIVTSQFSIEQCFFNDDATIAAIRRRCKVIHML